MSADSKTRWTRDFPRYAQNWKRLRNGIAISSDQYLELYRDGKLGPAENRYVYVVCKDHQEARKVIDAGRPLRPILIPGDAQSKQECERLLNYLRSQRNVYVAYFNREQDQHTYEGEDAADSLVQPVSVNGQDLVNQIRDNSEQVTLLNLVPQPMFENVVPACFADNYTYMALGHRILTGPGKREYAVEPVNISDSQHFMLGSFGYSFSDWHVDQMGFITTILIREGQKCWLQLPQLTMQEWEDWASRSFRGKPPLTPYGIDLQTGDLLIQPSSTFHAPFTVQNTVATGTMHIHSPTIYIHIRCARRDVAWTESTNEVPGPQNYRILAELIKLFTNPPSLYTQPSSKAVNLGFQALERYRVSFTEVMDCKHHCGSHNALGRTAYCPCKSSGLACSARCHNVGFKKCFNTKGDLTKISCLDGEAQRKITNYVEDYGVENDDEPDYIRPLSSQELIKEDSLSAPGWEEGWGIDSD